MGMTGRRGGEELGRISDLLTGCGLPLHGACAFAELSHNLLPCRAAARLPDKPGTVLTLLFPYRFPDRGPRNLSRYAACPAGLSSGGGRGAVQRGRGIEGGLSPLSL